MTEFASELAELMPETTTAPRQGVGVNVKRLLKLRGRLMASVFLGITIPAVVAIWLFVPREYVATASLEFKAVSTRIIGEDGRPLSGPTYDNFINTQIELITGYTILRRVLDSPEVGGIPSIAGHPDALHYLARNIQAANRTRTELVTLTYTHVNRDVAILVLNTALREYMAYIEEEEKNKGGLRKRTLTQKQGELRKELDQMRERIAELSKQLKVPVGESPGADPSEIESYRISLAQAEADLTTTETKARQTQKMIARMTGLIESAGANPNVPVYALGIEERVVADPNVMILSEQMAAIQQEYPVLKEMYVDDAPQLRLKKAEYDAQEEKLQRVKRDARRDAMRSLLAQYEYELGVQEADVEDATQRRGKFITLLEEYRQHNIEVSGGLAVIAEIERRYADTREYLRTLTNQLLTIEIESNAPARANVLGESDAPYRPDISRRLKYILVALFAAFSIAVAVGIVLEYTDQNIRSDQDISYATALPVLASVPHSCEDRLPERARMPTVTSEYPGSMTADEFRRVAARLLLPSKTGQEIRSCVITSPARGDGKTTLACNLAIILAQAGRRVLLVDGDSRNPSIERSFGLKTTAGLVEILAGEALSHDPDRTTDFENLEVLGPGLHGADLVEHLASHEMTDFLEGAQELFDHVIIDTPATLLTSEAKLLASMVDSVLLVAGVGVSSFGMLRRTIRIIDEIGGHVLGIVVNGVRQTPGGYLRQNLDLYYAQKQGDRGLAAGRPGGHRRGEPSILLTKGGKKG